MIQLLSRSAKAETCVFLVDLNTKLIVDYSLAYLVFNCFIPCCLPDHNKAPRERLYHGASVIKQKKMEVQLPVATKPSLCGRCWCKKKVVLFRCCMIW